MKRTTNIKKVTKWILAFLAIVIISFEYLEVSHFKQDFFSLSQLIINSLRSSSSFQGSSFVNFFLFNLVILVFLADVIIYLIKRNKKKKQEISSLNYEIGYLHNKINEDKEKDKQLLAKITYELNGIIQQKQLIIQKQEKKLEKAKYDQKSHQQELGDMNEGLLYLYYIITDEEDIKLDKHQIEKLTRCYKLLDKDFINNIEHLSTKPLTPKEELFCILWRVNKNREDIIKILNLSKDSYRQLKFRTLKKIKGEDSLKVFCDKIEGSQFL